MNIRGKITLIQLIVVAGFVFAFGFIMLRFYQAYALKQFELNSVGALADLRTFENETRYFPVRRESILNLWLDWNESYELFDQSYTTMLTSRGIPFLGPGSVREARDRLEAWDRLKLNTVAAFEQSMRSVLDGPMAETIGNEGVLVLLNRLRTGRETRSGTDVALITSLYGNVSILEAQLEEEVLSTTDYIRDIQARVAAFTESLYISTGSLAFVILVGGSLAALFFSRGINQRINLLESSLSRVTSGNFDINLDIRSGDEIESLAVHFNQLARDLWTRIDSMKDLMRDIGSTLVENPDIDRLEEFMLELAVDSTGADAGILMTVEGSEITLKQRLGSFPPPMAVPRTLGARGNVDEWFASRRLSIGETILGQIALDGESRFIRENLEGELPDNADPESESFIHSCIIVPLVVSDATLGVMALAMTRKETTFSDLDYAYMRNYGEFIALTLDNMYKYLELVKSHEIGREIEVAADIQRTLLPEKMPYLEKAEVAAYSRAAKGVSGDYYDIFDLGNGKTAIAVCDVSGKGVPASLMMIMIRTVLRSVSSPEKSADQIMTELNRAITGRVGTERFATIGLYILDKPQNLLSYANGAQLPLYILRSDSGKYRRFDTDGLPLGIDINASFGHKRIRVLSKDYIVLFTDGIPEARNIDGAELGTDRLLHFVARHATEPPREIVRLVRDYVSDFTAGTRQFDDQTFVALKVG